MRVSPQRHVLVQLRRTLGLSQKRLAQRVGVSRRTIQSVELGTLKLSERTAFVIASRTGVHPDWLLDNNLKQDSSAMLAKARKFSQEGWWSAYRGLYLLERLPRRMGIFRLYIFLRAIAIEFKREEWEKAKVGEKFSNLVADLLEVIPDERARELYLTARASVKDLEQVLRQVITDAEEALLQLKIEQERRRSRTSQNQV